MSKLKHDIEQMNNLNALSLLNVKEGEARPNCFKHFMMWSDNFVRISMDHDPVLCLSRTIRNTMVKQQFRQGVKS